MYTAIYESLCSLLVATNFKALKEAAAEATFSTANRMGLLCPPNPHPNHRQSLSGHPFAGYRGRCSKDSAPKDPQDCGDERPEMHSTQTASLTEHPEPVVAPQRKDVPDPCLPSRD